ncbi:MAG: AMIN domain-containing protein [Gammaproteobacteria bacterium]|nr:AMIN domain-containing protein [Gammaproteobacteria bacterium]NIR90077.1 AMIN domain-containing protein [Gammaproteobacteria bacterium]NIU03281.1 AMIN domain-containing protein [Gammaproteobacteria bacterium]NIV50775.1 AMIN domain-containing protein [Gammaproteobacteria bacterium]NIV75361.1 AMIN domain-containing protein [Gammaproteobacteria bacterium]
MRRADRASRHATAKVLTIASLMLIAGSAFAAQVDVSRVWMQDVGDGTSVVLELSARTHYTVFTLSDPERVVIDLKNTRLSRRVVERHDARRLVRGVRSAPRNGDDLRVVLDLQRSARARYLLQAPTADRGHRLVVRLDPAVAMGAQRVPVERGQVPEKTSAVEQQAPAPEPAAEPDTMTTQTARTERPAARSAPASKPENRVLAQGTGSSPARAQRERRARGDRYSGAYLGFHGGATLLNDVQSTYDDVLLLVPGVGTDDTFETSLDIGFNGGAVIGYRFASRLRLEAEATYRSNSVDEIDILGVDFDADGDVSNFAAMANLFYDFDTGTGFVPYIGGGAGISRVFLNDIELEGTNFVDDDDMVFAYQFGAGVAYPVTASASVSLDYRFFRTAEPGFKDVDGDSFDSDEYESHSVMLGLRFQF